MNPFAAIGAGTLATLRENGEIAILKSGELFGGRADKNRFTYYNIMSDRFELRAENSLDGETFEPGSYSFVAHRIGAND